MGEAELIRECAEVLDRAIERREQTRPGFALDAYRLLNGPGDGAPLGLALDRYGDALVLWARHGVPEASVLALVEAATARLQPSAVVLKRMAAKPTESTSELLFGELPSEPPKLREDDATFLCDLNSGVQTGLFLDLRDARMEARRYAAGAEVLNLFAYTSAFSVHAALAGAKRVTSVDVSKRALARGRENMVASGLDPDGHRWFADDVMKALRRPGTYELVIADPPVLGRAGGRTFSLRIDLQRLVDGLVAKVAPGGVLVLSAHALELSQLELQEAVVRAAEYHGVSVELLAQLGLPEWDHPVANDPSDRRDRGDYLKVLVIRVG